MHRSAVKEGSRRKSHVSALIMLMLLVLASCQPPGLASPITAGDQPGSLTLAWNPNSETDLAGYRLHYGTASNDYDVTVDVGRTLNCSVRGLSAGQTYYFALTAYNRAGVESEPSQEIVFDPSSSL